MERRLDNINHTLENASQNLGEASRHEFNIIRLMIREHIERNIINPEEASQQNPDILQATIREELEYGSVRRKEGADLQGLSSQQRPLTYEGALEKDSRLMDKAKEKADIDTKPHFDRRYKTNTYHEGNFVYVESRLRSPDGILNDDPQASLLYKNAIKPKTGVIVAGYNHKDEDVAKWESLPDHYKNSNHDIASPVDNSNILWNQYHSVAGDQPITRVQTSRLTNTHTINIMSHIFSQERQIKEIKTIKKGSEEYRAMRATPNVSRIFFLLEHHQKGREITHMKLKRELDYDVKGPYMKYIVDIYIGDKPLQPE